MEIISVCSIIIIGTVVFAAIVSQFATKLELKSQYEKPVPKDLKRATEEEEALLRKNFVLVGTRKGSKYTNRLLNEWCKSLYVSYGVVIDSITDATVGVGITNSIRKATVDVGSTQFEVEIETDAIINDKVIVFYSKDNQGNMVYRFVMVV